jgi:hypothetical protein
MSLRRIFLLSSSLVIVAGTVIAQPVVVARVRDYLARREAAHYASGLSPCKSADRQLLYLSPAASSAPGTTTILRLPSFSKPSALRISGSRVELFELTWAKSAAAAGGGVFQASLEYSADLPSTTSRRLQALLRADVSHAAAQLPPAIDGTSYYFHVPGSGCGVTWSPEGETRAARLVDLVSALSRYSRSGGQDPSQINSALLVLERQ